MTAGVGVLDAGVVLTRLDRRRRAHPAVVALFDRSARHGDRLHISVVNLAEVLHHARDYTEATGIDPVAVLRACGVAIDSPDIEAARRVARLASLADTSLADRFALATALMRHARLHTTDTTLAGFARRLRVPVTLY